MLWLALVIAVYAIGGCVTLYYLRKITAHSQELMLRQREMLEEEVRKKKALLRRLAKNSVRLVTVERLQSLKEKSEKLEEDLRTEQGRLSITQTELNTIDVRLCELEEIERELENSSFEAAQELEHLRSFEKEISERNLALREQLESALSKVDLLLDELTHSTEAIEQLTRAKSQMIEVESKIAWYETEISEINHKYSVLKRAYDALDIEYAQLYEKQADG